MFLKRLFKRPPPPEPVVEKLSLADLRERVRELEAEKLENVKPKLNPVLDAMNKQREALLNELKALEKAEPTEEIYPGLLKSATGARTLLVNKMTRALAEIKQPPEFSIAALSAFDGKLTKATNLTTDAVTTHGRYVGAVFGAGFAAVQTHMRELHGLAKQAHTTIEGAISESESLDQISSELESLAGLVEQVKGTQDSMNSLDAQAREIEDTLKKEGDRLAQLKSSEEFKRATDSAREADRIKAEINRVEGEAASAISDLNRPLRKLDKLVASGGYQMDRELVKTLELCIEGPAEIISTDEKISAAEALLRETAKVLSERKIDLGDRERRKKLERAQKLATGLREYKKRIDALNQKLEAHAQAMAHPVQKQVADLERSVGQLGSKLEQIKISHEELGHSLKRMNEEIEEKRTKLEGLAGEVLGTKVALTF